MFEKIRKGIKSPRKALRYFSVMVRYALRKKTGILFFLGMDSGGVFELIFRGYKLCYGFEPNPERFKKLQRKYSKYPNVHLFNVAAAQYDGEINFNITSNNGASSSVGHFDEEWKKFKSGDIKITKTIRVPCVNLLTFCKEHGIGYIDDYVSDIQGMDLEVLKTLKSMIADGKIRTITCEVTKDGKHNIYSDLPDNTESGFRELLKDNYELIAKGSGFLVDNQMDRVPDSMWEMDCKWRLKEKCM